MGRSGDSDDVNDNWATIRLCGAVKSAIRGQRGQAFLRELADTLDAMPEKVLIGEWLEDREGNFCALGAVGNARGIDLSALDPENYSQVARALDIPESLARQIMFENDRCFLSNYADIPIRRWARMRKWVDYQITNGKEK